MIVYPGMPGEASLRSAEKPPRVACHTVGEQGGHRFVCNRRKGHAGRHARIRYQFKGVVRAVWGTDAS